MELESLLSDDFVEFSAKIAELHEKKKAKKVELKEIYERFQEDIKALEAEAVLLKENFESEHK